MRRRYLGRAHSIACACAVPLMATPATAPAAQVTPTASAFQACLDDHVEQWLKARVNLVLNEDPAAGDIGDASVAKWTVETINSCRGLAGGSDAQIEQQFVKRMTQWREQIYNAAQRMRELVKPD